MYLSYQLIKSMKTTRNITGVGSPKNDIGKIANKIQPVGNKTQLMTSPRNQDKAKLSMTTLTQLNKWKSEKNLQIQNSEISTQDIQQKLTQPEVAEKSKTQTSKASQLHGKKLNTKMTRQGQKRQGELGSPKNINLGQGKNLSKRNNQQSYEIISKEMQNKFMEQINELEAKTMAFEKELDSKDEIIGKLQKQNIDLKDKYEKLKKLNQQNRKILKAKTTKFNEEGDQIRKLKERIVELENQVQSFKQKSTQKQFNFTNPSLKINKVESQIISQWVPINEQIEVVQSEIVKMSEENQIASETEKQKIDSKKILDEVEGRFSQIIAVQEEKIKQKQEIISDLLERLENLSTKNLEKEVEELKEENFRLRNNLIDNLKNRIEKKSQRKSQKAKKKEQIQDRLTKILQISKEQKAILAKMGEQYASSEISFDM